MHFTETCANTSTCTLYGYVRVCTKLYTVQYIYNYDHAEELEAEMNMSMNFK